MLRIHDYADPELMIRTMREELTEHGFVELRTPEEVDAALAETHGTLLLMVNSVCGCAAGAARPGVVLSLQGGGPLPQRLLTVFAGQDPEATARAREYLPGISPSSPAAYLFRDGQVVAALHRSDIEGYDAESIAARLRAAYAAHC